MSRCGRSRFEGCLPAFSPPSGGEYPIADSRRPAFQRHRSHHIHNGLFVTRHSNDSAL